MRKRVFIIHGWGGYPEEGWFPWLRRELVQRGIDVAVLPMPDADNPSKEQWVSFLKEQVGTCDEETYFVGHSLGVQTILRYLEHEPLYIKLGGAVFVAGFEILTPKGSEGEAKRILGPWLEAPIHWESVRGKSKNFVGIFSDNDRWVPIENVRLFDEKLGAKTLILHDRKHFSGSDGVTELPEVLDALLGMMP